MLMDTTLPAGPGTPPEPLPRSVAARPTAGVGGGHDRRADTRSEETRAMSNGVLGAMGIGVSDLDRSVDFYRRVLGMEQIGKLRLPEMDEVLLGYNRSRGPALVLMHYTDGREVDYAHLPVKV